jgi:NAD-dependent SIR2 family protein deacetylase
MKVAADVADMILRAHGRCLVITGAGCSTESGIPDYRSPDGMYRRRGFQPLTYQRFVNSLGEQRRYWGRSLLGYSRMIQAQCNPAHVALQTLGERGFISHVVTQNVDGLHHLAANISAGVVRAESESRIHSDAALTELHGNIHVVRCMRCADLCLRSTIQRFLVEENPNICERLTTRGEDCPDGDFHVSDEELRQISIPQCSCGGSYRPHVVLFGENVAEPVVSTVFDRVNNCDLLLCCGTSLKVYSAFRFVSAAREKGVKIVLLNRGATRADSIADAKYDIESLATTLHAITGFLVCFVAALREPGKCMPP